MDKKYYQSLLLQHYKTPHGAGEITNEYITAKGTNPLCGDEICVGINIENNTINDIRFNARACSICIASSSIMVTLLNKQPTSKVAELHAKVQALLDSELAPQDVIEALQPLSSIASMPSRHKCTLLGWEALYNALHS